MAIKYVQGDIFEYLKTRNKDNIILPHLCNSIGAWGKGFVIPLAQHFPEAKEAYKSLTEFKLGTTQFVQVRDNLIVANMIAQKGIGIQNGKAPIRYLDLFHCTNQVRKYIAISKNKYCIVSVKFGSGLAMGNWKIIEKIINKVWHDIDVTICCPH